MQITNGGVCKDWSVERRKKDDKGSQQEFEAVRKSGLITSLQRNQFSNPVCAGLVSLDFHSNLTWLILSTLQTYFGSLSVAHAFLIEEIFDCISNFRPYCSEHV